MVSDQQPKLCRILSLDGGGAKGFYTLGVLKEIEATHWSEGTMGVRAGIASS